MTFFENFKLLCESKGTSPNAVGKNLGIASATITGWKNGAKPGADKIKAIADYFRVSTDYLLTGSDGPQGSTPEPGDDLPANWDDEMRRKFKVMMDRARSPKVKKADLDLAEEMFKKIFGDDDE